MRKPVIAGNWKMNLLVADAVNLSLQLSALLDRTRDVEIVVCPVFTALDAVGKALKGGHIEMGGQDCYIKENGAFTGEVSPQMLKDVGCAWTIIGHSERRQYFNEDDVLLNKKLKFAITSGLKVMFCIGETLTERQDGVMDDVLGRQVGKGLDGLRTADFERVVIAYEPVWAIGTGVTATPAQAQEAHAFVRGLIREQFGESIANNLRIQYGGSVKPDNAADLMGQPDVDGALVGGASLQAEGFAAIVRAAA